MINKINLSPAVRHYQQKALSFKGKQIENLNPIELKEKERMDYWSLEDFKNGMRQRMEQIGIKFPFDNYYNGTDRGSSVEYHSENVFFVHGMKLLYNRVIELTKENQELKAQKAELIEKLGYDPFQFTK